MTKKRQNREKRWVDERGKCQKTQIKQKEKQMRKRAREKGGKRKKDRKERQTTERK